ncbi:helix-turn-helix domain-containing protein [Qipengyuania spongiae]|uniref:Helix-turn-helix domain-containing protein n=1 Tax=Qipengyuania spongiae TaxID=2909673 RepID=A0ABY5T1F8_9SPHN|nr:MerR family transcriptional regulator [Qipengyuania spongiae]UVI39339.1 helix-turn-helix domain-containing protein [Qipengyuania spongiae]
MERNLTLTQFTPAEAENVTGVSTQTQRDWRRRGILAKRDEGHARYDLFDLAEMMAIKLLSDRGVPLIEAADVADWCGMGIGYRALEWHNAYEGDHDRTNEARGLPNKLIEQNAAMFETIREAAGIAEVDLPENFEKQYRWSDKGEWLAGQVYRERFKTGVIPGQLFIWWADGQHTFHQSFDAARDDMSSGDPRLAGPALVLDLHSLASTLLTKTGRALVHVEFPDLPVNPDA